MQQGRWKREYNFDLREENTTRYQLFHFLILSVYNAAKDNLSREIEGNLKNSPFLQKFFQTPSSIGGQDDIVTYGLLKPFYEELLKEAPFDESGYNETLIRWLNKKFLNLLDEWGNVDRDLALKKKSLEDFYGLTIINCCEDNGVPTSDIKIAPRHARNKVKSLSSKLPEIWKGSDWMLFYLKKCGLQINPETHELEEFKKPKKKKKKKTGGAASAVREDLSEEENEVKNIDLGPSLFAQVAKESLVTAPREENKSSLARAITEEALDVEEEEMPIGPAPVVSPPKEKDLGKYFLVGVRELADFVLKNRESSPPLKRLKPREQSVLDSVFDYEKRISWKDAQEAWKSLGGTFELNRGTSHGRYRHPRFGRLSGHGSMPHGGHDNLSSGALSQFRSYILVLGYKPSEWVGEIDLATYVKDRTYKR
jgi:hypothetical protein